MWTGPVAITRAELALWSGSPEAAATPSSSCSTGSSPATRTPSTSRPPSPSERGPPPTSPWRPGDRRRGGRVRGRRVRRDARGPRAPARAPRGVPGRPLPARGAAERRDDAGRARAGHRERRRCGVARRRRALGRVRGALCDRLRALAPGRGDPRRRRCARRRPGRAGRRPRRRRTAARPTARRGARSAGDAGRGCRWTAAPRPWPRGRWRRRCRARRSHRARARGPAARGRGETNRSIGQALYISEKTVSVHISRILAKLDVRGRVEAAGLAIRLGLLEETEAAPDG